jgi:hypothetical protein
MKFDRSVLKSEAVEEGKSNVTMTIAARRE